MFARLCIYEYKLYNMNYVNIVFGTINFWRHQELVGSVQYFSCDWRVGSDRVTEMNPWDISGRVDTFNNY